MSSGSFPERPTRRPLLQATVARRDERGTWWVMSRRETGWAAYGYPTGSLDDLTRLWAARRGGVDRDEHGEYVVLIPEPEPRRLAILSRDGTRALLLVDERTALRLYDALEGHLVVADPETHLPVDLLEVHRRLAGAP